MSKLDDINNARVEGMDYATRIIEKNGMNAWKQELKLRQRNGISLPLKPKDFIREADNVQKVIISQCLLMSIAVLLDEFDFTKEQLIDFTERFNRKSDCMTDDYHLWQDYADMMKVDYDIDVGVVCTRKD